MQLYRNKRSRSAKRVLSHWTDLRDVHFNILNAGAFDRLWRLLDDTLDKNNALVGDSSSPFDHLLGDLLGGDQKKCLDGIGALTEVQEDHLVSLSSGGVHSSSEQHGLPVARGTEG